MERLYSKILGTPVAIEGSNRPLHTVKDLILDPDRGDLLAFVVDINKNLIVMPSDVLHWSAALVINGMDAIIEAEDVIRVNSVLEDGRGYIESKVETESGEHLGKVFDLTIDDKNDKIRNLYVAKGFLGLVRYQARIIPVDQIIEILEDKIMVKDSLQLIKDQESIAVQDAATT
jgi:uncharacterized protein YrrD